MYQAEFVQTCTTSTPLLKHYENVKTRNAGVKTKKAIINDGRFTKWDLFIDYSVKVVIFRYMKKTYACVIHSAIDYIYLLHT